jgi:hypothetical protein
MSKYILQTQTKQTNKQQQKTATNKKTKAKKTTRKTKQETPIFEFYLI